MSAAIQKNNQEGTGIQNNSPQNINLQQGEVSLAQVMAELRSYKGQADQQHQSLIRTMNEQLTAISTITGQTTMNTKDISSLKDSVQQLQEQMEQLMQGDQTARQLSFQAGGDIPQNAATATANAVNELYTEHLNEKLNGLTAKLYLRGTNQLEASIVDELLGAMQNVQGEITVKQLQEHCIVTFSSEQQRNKAVPSLKRLTRANYPFLRVVPLLTNLQKQNKTTLYTALKADFKLVDWGDRVLINNSEQSTDVFREIVQLGCRPAYLDNLIQKIRSNHGSVQDAEMQAGAVVQLQNQPASLPNPPACNQQKAGPSSVVKVTPQRGVTKKIIQRNSATPASRRRTIQMQQVNVTRTSNQFAELTPATRVRTVGVQLRSNRLAITKDK